MKTNDIILSAREYVNRMLAREMSKGRMNWDGDIINRLNRIMDDMDWLINRWSRPGVGQDEG